jgi:endonuclease/exonuclease/phosphatase family metal-dependent hydrolase
VRALLGASRAADVIGGDLNAPPDSTELAVVDLAGWHDAERRRRPDVPAAATNWAPGPRTAPPTQRLDYLLTRAAVQVRDAEVPTDWRAWGALSDHLPVVARLTR